MNELQWGAMPVFDGKAERRWVSGVGFALFALSAVALAAQLAAVAVISLAAPDAMTNTTVLFAVSMGTQYLVAGPVFWAILQTRRKTVPEKHSMSFGGFCMAFLMCIPIMYIGSFAGNGLSALLNLIVGTETSNEVMELIGSGGIASAFLFPVILAPILEELVFRKLLCDRMLRYGDKAAVIVSGVIFGLYHANLYQFFYAAALGFFFAFVYCRTGRLIYPILLHMLVNFFGSAVPMLVTEFCGELMTMALSGDTVTASAEIAQQILADPLRYLGQLALLSGYGLFIMGGISAGLIAMIVCRKKFVFRQGPVCIPKGQGLRTMVLNAGSVFALAALLGVLVMNTFG